MSLSVNRSRHSRRWTASLLEAFAVLAVLAAPTPSPAQEAPKSNVRVSPLRSCPVSLLVPPGPLLPTDGVPPVTAPVVSGPTIIPRVV